MKKHLILLILLILFTGCQKQIKEYFPQETITESAYLNYKDLYCEKFIGHINSPALLERSSLSIIDEESIHEYDAYVEAIKKIDLPVKYQENIEKIINYLQIKKGLALKYTEAANRFRIRYPEASYLCEQGNENCTPITDEGMKYYDTLFLPLEKTQRDANANILLNHDQIFLIAKGDLNIVDKQAMCGENESAIRNLFETQ